MKRFKDRKDAGKQLACLLEKFRDTDAIVYGLARGGVPIAYEVAKKLNLPIDVLVPRKIGHPHNSEYAICATVEDGTLVCNEDEADEIDQEWLKNRVLAKEREALERARQYRGGRSRTKAAGRTAIIVDDGMATGLTMVASFLSVKKDIPKNIVVAVPITTRDAIRSFEGAADVVAVVIAEPFLGAIGYYYESFSPTSDEEVIGQISELWRSPSM